MKLSIIIPVYNEERTVREVVAKVEGVPFGIEREIIIVDDGSTDSTPAIVDEFKSRHLVLRHERNKGKGGAIHTGLAHASGDYVVIQDADLECDPGDLRRLVDLALEEGAPVVYGSRVRKDPNVSRSPGIWYYRLGGLYVTFLANLLYGTNITDEPVAYKLVRSDILKGLGLASEGFGFCAEVTAKLGRRRIPIREVAISYFPRNHAAGKKTGFKDAVSATWILLKHKFAD